MPSSYSDAGHFEHLTVTGIPDVRCSWSCYHQRMTYVSHGLVMESRHKNVAFVLSVPYLLKYKTKFFSLNLVLKYVRSP
jgi:hypothetical protein